MSIFSDDIMRMLAGAPPASTHPVRSITPEEAKRGQIIGIIVIVIAVYLAIKWLKKSA